MNVLLVGAKARHIEVIRAAVRRSWFAPGVVAARTGEEAACVALEIEPDLVIVGEFLSDMSLGALTERLRDFGYEGPVGAIVRDVRAPTHGADFVLPDGFGSRVSRRIFAQLGLTPQRPMPRAA